jgi:hypothetical protein
MSNEFLPIKPRPHIMGQIAQKCNLLAAATARLPYSGAGGFFVDRTGIYLYYTVLRTNNRNELYILSPFVG